jgi:hypothetical protein
VLDLEIGKRICFVKINQVVTKSDPNIPNSLKVLLVFNLHFLALLDILVQNELLFNVFA